MPGAFENFPYSNFHELNLDWVIQKLKEAVESSETAYTPNNPPPYPVTSVDGQTGDVVIDYPVSSVNGQTGAVHLYAVNDGVYIRFPDASSSNWNIYRSLDGVSTGIQFQKNGKLQRVNGQQRIDVYDAENQPPYPVGSVNGQTGDVVLYTLADSATGIHIQLPDALTKTGWSLRRMLEDNTQTGIQFTKDGAMQRINGNYVYNVYDAGSPPPYPVTSVNGQTGAVVTPFAVYSEGTDILTLSVPSTEAAQWGLAREVGDNGETLQIHFEGDGVNGPSAYITYKDDGGVTTITRKLLTPNDIPSSSGVVSVNGMNGVVSLDGTNLYVDLTAVTPVSIVTALAGKQDTLAVPGTMDASPTSSSTKPVTSGGVYSALAGKQDTLAVPDTMDASPTSSSTKPVTSGGVYSALADKQDTLAVPDTMDANPTSLSTKPVTSGGVYSAISSAMQTAKDSVNGELAYIENGTTASRNIAPGTYLYRNGTLYQYTGSTTLLAGGTIVDGDLTEVTAGGLNSLNSNISNLNTNIATYQPTPWTGNATATEINNLTTPGIYRRYVTSNLIDSIPGGWVTIIVSAVSGYANYGQILVYGGGIMYTREKTDENWNAFARVGA